MAVTKLNTVRKIGDLVKSEYDQRICREHLATVTTASAQTHLLGVVVGANGTQIAASGEANAYGVVIDDSVRESGTSHSGVNIIARGPVLLNKGMVVAGAADLDAIETALKAKGIVLIDEISETTEHTT